MKSSGLLKFIIFLIVLLLNFSVYWLLTLFKKPAQCPLEGPQSSAPLNKDEFLLSISDSIDFLKTAAIANTTIDVILTTANSEAATNNLPVFLLSISRIHPPFISNVIICCLDTEACKICADLHKKELCIHMNLDISTKSLGPGGR